LVQPVVPVPRWVPVPPVVPNTMSANIDLSSSCAPIDVQLVGDTNEKI
jgi:hypothetical protein